MGLFRWLGGRESTCQCSRPGCDPWGEKTLGEGDGNPLQWVSCLGNSTVREAWWATVHGVTKQSDTTGRLKNNNSVGDRGKGHLIPLLSSCKSVSTPKAKYGVTKLQGRTERNTLSVATRLSLHHESLWPHSDRSGYSLAPITPSSDSATMRLQMLFLRGRGRQGEERDTERLHDAFLNFNSLN